MIKWLLQLNDVDNMSQKSWASSNRIGFIPFDTYQWQIELHFQQKEMHRYFLWLCAMLSDSHNLAALRLFWSPQQSSSDLIFLQLYIISKQWATDSDHIHSVINENIKKQWAEMQALGHTRLYSEHRQCCWYILYKKLTAVKIDSKPFQKGAIYLTLLYYP